jgi:hypothetical protein
MGVLHDGEEVTDLVLAHFRSHHSRSADSGLPWQELILNGCFY